MPPITDGTIGLNNYLQSKNILDSLSWVETSSGSTAEPTWIAICKINGMERGRGTGAQKFIARKAAANQALAYFRNQNS